VTLGAYVGTTASVGTLVTIDGLSLGEALGDSDGASLGMSVGTYVGLVDGRALGEALGNALGLVDGEKEGDTVGVIDGALQSMLRFCAHIPNISLRITRICAPPSTYVKLNVSV